MEVDVTGLDMRRSNGPEPVKISVGPVNFANCQKYWSDMTGNQQKLLKDQYFATMNCFTGADEISKQNRRKPKLNFDTENIATQTRTAHRNRCQSKARVHS